MVLSQDICNPFINLISDLTLPFSISCQSRNKHFRIYSFLDWEVHQSASRFRSHKVLLISSNRSTSFIRLVAHLSIVWKFELFCCIGILLQSMLIYCEKPTRQYFIIQEVFHLWFSKPWTYSRELRYCATISSIFLHLYQLFYCGASFSTDAHVNIFKKNTKLWATRTYINTNRKYDNINQVRCFFF